MEMQPKPKNHLTDIPPSSTLRSGGGGDVVDDEKQKQWSKRYNWAQCREPFKTEFDTLASHWAEGQLSSEGLALELWQLREKLLFIEGSAEATRDQKHLSDVHLDLEIIVEAMLSACLYPPGEEIDRYELLDHARQMQSGDQGRSRHGK